MPSIPIVNAAEHRCYRTGRRGVATHIEVLIIQMIPLDSNVDTSRLDDGIHRHAGNSGKRGSAGKEGTGVRGYGAQKRARDGTVTVGNYGEGQMSAASAAHSPAEAGFR
jgi:hypothetical protein